MATYSTNSNVTSVSEGGIFETEINTTGVSSGSIVYYALDSTDDPNRETRSISGADLAKGTIVGQTTIIDNKALIRHQITEDYVAGEQEHIKINLYSDKPYGTLVHVVNMSLLLTPVN